MRFIYGTVIYNCSNFKQFIFDYLSSVNEQTYNDFELLLVLDDVGKAIVSENLDKYFKKNINVIIMESGGTKTPIELRKMLVSEAYKNNADVLIFSDFDESVAINRISEVSKYINDYDFVFNDFYIADENLNHTCNSSYFSSRKLPSILDDWTFIKNYNFVGFGSLAINLKSFDYNKIVFPENIKALDWYLITLILINGGKGMKLESTYANYRQHMDSYVGFDQFLDKNKLLFGLDVKKRHYKYFSKITSSPICNEFNKLYNLTLELENNISNGDFLEKYLDMVNSDINRADYCWWENIKLNEDINGNI